MRRVGVLGNVTSRVVEAHGRARDLLRAEGVEERVGHWGRYLALDAVVGEHEQANRSA